MRHQTFSCGSQPRGSHLKWIVVAVLIVMNLAAQTWGKGSERSAVDAGDAKMAIEPARAANGVTFSLLVGAGLLIAGSARSRRRRSEGLPVGADFEKAFRMQHGPRLRVDRTPLIRDGSMRLRRNASRLGCDQ